jgi:aspartyl-tRNA(Asn)/glutamyl-tRNA(Gln) amidotransferase subunit B
MIGDFARLLNASGTDIADARIGPADLHALIELIEDGTISGKIAKSVFEEMFSSGKPPAAVVQELGLEQISGSDEIGAIVDAIIERNPKPVEEFRAGKQEALKFLVGQAMRETRGRANPASLTEILRTKLEAKV